MQNRTRSILDELATMSVSGDKENLIESRASNVIAGAINLINFIREHYSDDVSLELERRLLNSIRMQDPQKFNRGIKKVKSNES